MNPSPHYLTPTAAVTAAFSTRPAPPTPVPTRRPDNVKEESEPKLLRLPFKVPDEPVFVWDGSVTATAAAGRNARLLVRTRLTVARWPGDVEDAARIVEKLVDNAVKHTPVGETDKIPVHLYVDSDSQLLVEVDDPMPEFPGFAAAVAWHPAKENEKPRGLWRARECGAGLAFRRRRDANGLVMGKAVQALLTGAVPEVSA
ncbi:ATP-binding protein [Streptomyces glomeratus]|uniref:Histidine kinase/HSP90-like ATPase domain-containing protein n=1 Tax=Streptomyces glomeratus TaxID=284452 RepID=A0ABP6M4X7_9ACTN|nr:ATP-binding protein [Streptomyces glomeratus]MCF1511383.1 ATP-binding protein [Streptomyces glomeratus]